MKTKTINAVEWFKHFSNNWSTEQNKTAYPRGDIDYLSKALKGNRFSCWYFVGPDTCVHLGRFSSFEQAACACEGARKAVESEASND